MKKFSVFIAFLLIGTIVYAQTEKRPLTFDEILKWKRITETHLSNNGKYIVYKEDPWKGDPVLKITTPNGKEQASIDCGTNAAITADSKYVIFTLKAPVDTVRMLKLKDTKKDDLPKDKLVIYDLANNEREEIELLKSVKVPEKWSGWIVYQTDGKTAENGEEKGRKKKDKEGSPLFIKNLSNGEIKEIPSVDAYEIAEEKAVLTFVSSGDSLFESGTYVYDLASNTEMQILDSLGQIKQLTINKTGDKVAFLCDSSNVEDESNYQLFLWEGSGMANVVVKNEDAALPEDRIISENGGLSFSDNNMRLFFGTAPPQVPKDTTVLEEEIPVLDIWHWNEEELHTVQLNNKSRDERKTYLAVYDVNEQNTVQLETEKFSGIRTINEGDADHLLAYSNRPYAVQSMWEGSPQHLDFYLVDVKTGEAKMFKEDCRARPSTSPEGKFVYWYDAADTSWNTYEIASGKEFKITTPTTIQVADELNDVPNLPGSYRSAGWLENDEAFLVYDRYDIWKVYPTNASAPVNLTQNGRDTKVSYRLVRFNPERNEAIVPDEEMILEAHNETTRADSYLTFDLNKTGEQKVLLAEQMKLNTPQKAKDDDLIVFTRENFETYPNLVATDLSFKKQTQVSDAAPQQNEFNWGTAELVTWRSLDGLVLEGTLHKPENFDPNKKYPMIVNFYEKSSQNLLSYRMPENNRSTVDYHYYTSNGYVIFNPDVYYREGYPGESAFNCVMPGVNHVVEMGFIDPKRIGAQGHSWGGYQVAYLSTRTNMFAAIESGAPVVNMFSAYGGIRWGSGLNRSFQYEHTQSRIGKSIWEAPLRYLENSPLFTADKIETPILIMHNDDDGAVPWYQGIEFFIALRRMGKPAWMLNYNEADHWPLKIRDKNDFQIRMAQFFDHYLKDKPMPKWMKEGIPATKKSIDMGYELVD